MDVEVDESLLCTNCRLVTNGKTRLSETSEDQILFAFFRKWATAQ